MEFFEEVSVGPGRRSKVHCAPHKQEVCGVCCADFRLINTLPYDERYVDLKHNETARCNRAQAVIDEYFRNPVPVSGPPSSWRLPGLMDQFLNQQEDIDLPDATMLLAYMTYTARLHHLFRQRLVTALDWLIQSSPLFPSEHDDEADRNLKQLLEMQKAHIKQTIQAEKAQKKAAGQHKQMGVESLVQNARDQMAVSVNEMMLLLTNASCCDMGPFFSTFLDHVTAVDELNLQHGGLPSVPLPNAAGYVDMSTLKPHAEWLKFVLEHGEQVPVDDPAAWPRTKLLDFLRKHQVEPEPLPPQEILVKVAKHMIQFCFACLTVLDTMPTDEQAGALGRESMGISEEGDQAILDGFYATREKPKFYIDAQIGEAESLTSLPAWSQHFPACEFFQLFRGLYLKKYGTNEKTNLYNELLQTLEAVASTYDKMRDEPESDLLVQVNAAEDTVHAQSMAIRPLAAWCDGEFDTSELPDPIVGRPTSREPVPLLAVEYYHSRKAEGGASKVRTFMNGMTEKTLTRECKTSIEETELLLKLLKENRVQLNSEDELVQKYEKKAAEKGWSFSVVRAADPTKRGGALTCAACGKRAPLTCSRCKEETYCSKSCQLSAWKIHKKTCKTK